VPRFTKCAQCLGYRAKGIKAAATRNAKHRPKLKPRLMKTGTVVAVNMPRAGVCACGLGWMMSISNRNFVIVNNRTRSAQLCYHAPPSS
jgi:hypothetical protein